MNSLRRPLATAVLALMLSFPLASCGLFGGSENVEDSTLEVTSARYALTFGDIIRGPRRVLNRPSSSLGIFAGLFLSAGNFVDNQSALQGVQAQAAYHAEPGEEQLEDTFALLQEFGAVLQVDVPDLLNRSDNRTETFNRYLEGLSNITERSTRRADELRENLDTLEEEERVQRRAASDLDRAIRNAIADQDYVTAGEMQPELAKAQGVLAETESKVAQQEVVVESFDDLLEVAERQKTVLEENREVILAGLRVVDLPGAESLGILENATTRRRNAIGL